MKKVLFFFTIGFIILYGCGSKKSSIEYKEVIKRDSIYITKNNYITKQVNDTITIEAVCDTLGQLKDFDRVIKSNNVKVSLKSVKGNIQASVNIDSIVNSKITEFKNNYVGKVKIQKEEIIRYKIPFWLWIIITLESIIIFLLLKIKFF